VDSRATTAVVSRNRNCCVGETGHACADGRRSYSLFVLFSHFAIRFFLSSADFKVVIEGLGITFCPRPPPQTLLKSVPRKASYDTFDDL
jgi:hypothetical protein